MIEPPGTAALRHLHFRASVHPPEGLYIRQLLNARYIVRNCYVIIRE